jgi:hypothetical protein
LLKIYLFFLFVRTPFFLSQEKEQILKDTRKLELEEEEEGEEGDGEEGEGEGEEGEGSEGVLSIDGEDRLKKSAVL